MRRIVHLILVLTLYLSASSGVWANPVQQPTSQTGPVAALVRRLTPAEKIGQLFVVTFYGPSAAPGSDIQRLITEYHVGGVVLSAANDNITDTLNAPAQVLTLTNQLQAAVFSATQGVSPTSASPAAPYIPLFIALQQEGNGYPFSAIRSGLTDMPSSMAIGATWDPTYAEAMGNIVGSELAALGVNMLLGPALDVNDTPRPGSSGDLDTRVFGGDPYWVGVMGQAYIRGLHIGADQRLAVVAKHFPGLGSSDRNPDSDQDVPTVRKLLEQLKQNELVPFFAVTGGVTDTTAMADALLTTHIRFVGFQGNPRQTTRPISFDEQALGQLLALPEIAAWRTAGGVTLSDALGVEAVKRFYDPSERTFNNKRIAREAFAAGNDLLYLADFGLNPRLDQTDTIIDTLTYFTQQYEADPVFADKVDAAVTRLLTLKLRLSGGAFDLARTLRPDSGLADLRAPARETALRALAQSAATLVGLTDEEAAARLAEPPAPTDRLVFFTDARQGRECATCPAYPLIDKRELERAILRRYGPAGSGQVREGNLLSFTFDELAAHFAASRLPTPVPSAETPTPEPSPLETALLQSDWIVFNLLDVTAANPASSVLSTFLAQRADLTRNKKIIVFAFGAPYYLDATDVSKLTAYYALYSKAPIFVDVAARLLFREFAPQGALPVSVPSVGYDLRQATAPDPAQFIDIVTDQPDLGPETPTAAPGGITIKRGDTLHLRTGVILDLNGHPVPDGTQVSFSILYADDILPAIQTALTQAGVAATSLILTRVGSLRVTAASEPALASTIVQLTVFEDTGTIEFLTPTPEPSATPQPTPTLTPVTPTPLPSPTPTPVIPPPTPARVGLRDFIMMCVGLVAATLVGYRLGGKHASGNQRFRVGLAGAIGVLIGYNYFALALPGAEAAYQTFNILAATICVVMGALLGLLTGWYWFVRRARG